MSKGEGWILLALTILTAIIIPLLALMLRLVGKWTRAEAKLEMLADDIKELVKDKDKVHAEMLGQMRDDRAVTDKRLRWLEENLWTGRGKGGKHAIRD